MLCDYGEFFVGEYVLLVGRYYYGGDWKFCLICRIWGDCKISVGNVFWVMFMVYVVLFGVIVI